MRRKPRLPPGATYVGNGPVSTLFEWHDKMYRFAQGRRGGTIHRAYPICGKSIIFRAYWHRYTKRTR